MYYQLKENIHFVNLGKETLMKVGESLFQVNEDAKEILELTIDPISVQDLTSRLETEKDLLIDTDGLSLFLFSQIDQGVLVPVAGDTLH